MIADVQERYHVYCIIPGGASYGADQQVLGYWNKLLGTGRVIKLESPEDTSECIGLTIGMNEGAITMSDGVAQLQRRGLVGRTVDRISQALSSLVMFCKVCDAVQYAHQELVVHRDLKPSNVLVTADGIPKLLDFGIAKVLNPNPSAPSLLRTHTGTRCMTPAYASPEQMRGKSVSPATDVYSLGVVLYELLTGHRPYRLTQHTPAEMERAICEQEPEIPSTVISRVETDTSSDGRPITTTPESVSQTREGQPDKLRRRLRGDLDNIILKALQKEPQRRYDSVEEFSQDIGRHLQHVPVKARPSTLGYRVSKFVQRHRIEVSATAIVLLVLAAAALLTFNALGLRDRILGSVPSTRVQSPKGALPPNPKGWIAIGESTAKPVTPCENLATLKLPNTTFRASRWTPVWRS